MHRLSAYKRTALGVLLTLPLWIAGGCSQEGQQKEPPTGHARLTTQSNDLPPLAFPPTLAAIPVRMRDGVSLSTHVWLPSPQAKHPTIVMRTPYGLRWGPGADMFKLAGLQKYVEEGYAVVIQDTRGTATSEGEFSLFASDALDGYDTIEWVAAQSWSNGDVAMDGASYMGTVQWLAAAKRPPHLKCIAPAAPAGEPFGEVPYMGGAFRLEWALPYLAMVAGQDARSVDWNKVLAHRPLDTADSLLEAPIPEYRDWLAHPTYDEYWQRAFLREEDFAGIDIPFMTVTGWFDEDMPGTLRYWRATQQGGSSNGSLIIGPWNHMQTYLGGEPKLELLSFSEDAVLDLQAERLAFFDRCLKGKPGTPPPRVRAYLTGSNQWRTFDQYPPRQMQRVPFYLRSDGHANTRAGDGALSISPPRHEPSDSFVFDPRRPVPHFGGAVDVGANEEREDVLVYSSEVLREPLTLLGPVEVVLYAATDGRDTDWVVKLVDVHPDGTAVGLNQAGGILRARYREGYEQQKLLEPGAVEKYTIQVWNIGHTLLPGHRLRLHVTSSAYPYVNPNQNTGNAVASDVEWRAAKQTVYHEAGRASHVLLPVLKQ
jgi:putative CocE/NonD family hydrolase